MGIKKTVETLVAAVTSTDVATIEGELTKQERRRAQLAESSRCRYALCDQCISSSP